MLQNKIYRNFIKEILKTFLVILFGLSVIAWTVRAVNFLDLIVENGHSISTYFYYSFLNLFGIITKFIPLSFLLSLMVFIIKQINENEFLILWTSGVKKIKIANLFFVSSLFVLVIYLTFSIFLTPLALNQSRNLLSQNNYNSFLPTIRIQQFSDSFKGFTFMVEKKVGNELKNVFIHDDANTLKNLTSDSSTTKSTTIVAQNGIVQEKQMILFDGQILTSKKNNLENDVVKFQQLNIDLKNLQTSTIKVPKLQETSTIDLIKCLSSPTNYKTLNCAVDTKKEIITVLNRRISLPFYIPIVALLCSFLLIKSQKKNSYIFNKYSIFGLSFFILLYSELIIRYTGISKFISTLFIISPFLLVPIVYFFLIFQFSKESLSK